MSDFNNLSRQQLNDAAERFGLTIDNRWSATTLAGKLIEAGVTIDQIRGAEEVLGASPDTGDALDKFSQSEDSRVVLFMDRPNKSYSIMGHKFTSDHPYVVMSESEALTIMELDEDFRIAHPSEAARFYKGADANNGNYQKRQIV